MLRIDKDKILIEGMDLSGKTTIVEQLSSLIDKSVVRRRTISEKSQIYDFTVAQSKAGTLHIDLISQLYKLAISEDLYNYQPADEEIVLQDSYFALRSYAYAKEKGDNVLAQDIYKLLKLYPKPELTFYLTATTEERLKRNQKRDKPMAYMEKLLLTNPHRFESIESYLKDITTSLFNAEIINTQDRTSEEIALYIFNKINDLRKDERNGRE